MCIVLLTTGHPEYALIVINNRDEFILRPTSRPHWWTLQKDPELLNISGNDTSNGKKAGVKEGSVPEILSSRDLNRPERGTWLGVTRSGNFACLTNYREDDPHEGGAHAVHGVRSRGAIVSAWLGADPKERTTAFVERMLSGPGVRGVGGFSLACGKLRRRRRRRSDPDASAAVDEIEPLVIISNRSEHPDHVPRIASRRGETQGLSNAAFDASGPPWPKIERGSTLLDAAVARHVAASAASGAADGCNSNSSSEDALVDSLFTILDTDTLPRLPEGEAGFTAYIPLLKQSIFVPPLGDEERRRDTENFDEAARRANIADHKSASAHSDAAVPITSIGMANGVAIKSAAGGEREGKEEEEKEEGMVVAVEGAKAVSSNGAAVKPAAPGPPGPEDRSSAPAAAKAETTPVVVRPAEADQIMGFSTGVYGTQRQTVILVDWDGNVRYTERALWDEYGKAIERGQGDVTFRFKIEEWEDGDGW